MREREENYGFSADELNTILCNGVKPWDDDACETLHFLEHHQDEDDQDDPAFEQEIEEREQNYGFTADELNMILCNRVKP